MHFKDVRKGLEFSTLLDHISLSSVQEIEILTYENAGKYCAFSLGNLIQSHGFTLYHYTPKLSPVQSCHLPCNFLLHLFTWMPQRHLKLKCKMELIIFCSPCQSLLFPLCSLLILWVVSLCAYLSKLEVWPWPGLLFSSFSKPHSLRSPHWIHLQNMLNQFCHLHSCH